MREREAWSLIREVSRLFLGAIVAAAAIGALAPLTVVSGR